MINIDVKHAHKEIYTGHLRMRGESPSGEVVDFTNYYMTKNGQAHFVVSGEFHFSRYDSRFWEEEILKIKAGGVNLIATYMFWNHHENEIGNIDFTGNRDIRLFLQLCAKHDVRAILRIGPYAHGECRNGGLPDWMFGRPFEVRTNDEGYLFYVRRYFAAIGEQVADLMFTKGGNVVGIQLENEYMAACSPWDVTVAVNREWMIEGRDGLAHIEMLRSIAQDAGISSAFLTCTGWGGAPCIDNEMLPLWGGYAYCPWEFWEGGDHDHSLTGNYIFVNGHNENDPSDYDKKYPYACCELGGGMQVWYPYRFVVEPESVEAMILVKVAGGCNFIGYYMYHGGRNPVINGISMNEQLTPRVSYDFQAPIGDFGRVKESYHRIRLLHYMFKACEGSLCDMDVVIDPEQSKISPEDVTAVRYGVRSNGESGFLILNNYQDHVNQTDKSGLSFCISTKTGELTIPAAGEITLPKDASCMLPFNLKLGSVTLATSTAQYITTVADAAFFFCHDGIDGVMCFERGSVVTDAENVSVTVVDGMPVISVCAGVMGTFTVSGVKICVLTRAQSLRFWRADVCGVPTAILSGGVVYGGGDTLYIERIGGGDDTLLSYPALPPCQLESTGKSGMFFGYHQPMEACKITPEISMPYKNRAELKIDPSCMADLSELYLKIDYDGDIGWAFINGELIHDDYNNGTTWTIGLKAFAEKLSEHSLYLYISPSSKSVSSNSESTFTRITCENGVAEFKSISLECEKTIVLKF